MLKTSLIISVKNKFNNLLDSTKSINFNKKTYFKLVCLCIIQCIDFMIRYYHMIHKHLQYAFIIQFFFFFTQLDTYHISYNIENYKILHFTLVVFYFVPKICCWSWSLQLRVFLVLKFSNKYRWSLKYKIWALLM